MTKSPMFILVGPEMAQHVYSHSNPSGTASVRSLTDNDRWMYLRGRDPRSRQADR